MRTIVRACLMVVLVTSMAGAASAQGAPIVPGQSIGDFRVGQDLPGVIAALGPLHSEDDLPGGGFAGYYWPLKRIGVIADKTTGRIAALVVSLDDTYKTEKGVGAGADMEAVRTAYGQEDSVDTHQDDSTMIYDKIGVAFVVDSSGALQDRVTVIFVFAPGRYRDIFTPDQ